MLLIPFIILLLAELLDNKIRVIKEVVNATRIPLLGVIGKITTTTILPL
jgi:capsular polysaccharide biosynthesis protein